MVFCLWFSGFCFLPCFFVECNPCTLDLHGVGCLVLVLNLVLLTAPSWGYVQFLELLISAGCRCYGSMVFFQHTSWCSCQLFQLHLWWLVWPLPYCSIFCGTQSGDLHTSSSSLWLSSGCCSHLEWPHLWFGTYQTSSPLWICLVCFNGYVCQIMIGVPQDSCLLILHHSFRLMLIPALCFQFDAIVPAYVQVQLGSYLVVPVKVLICC